jgi:hypothetical protein
MFDSNDDWVEGFRRTVYPRIHRPLSKLGDLIGIDLYATGSVGWNQYVGTVYESEETLEQELDGLSAERNLVACLKSLPDGRTSEGSWVFRHKDEPDLIEEGMQLHLTLFKTSSGRSGRAVYAHYEDDWQNSPLSHLQSKNFSPKKGVAKAGKLFDQKTFITIV